MLLISNSAMVTGSATLFLFRRGGGFGFPLGSVKGTIYNIEKMIR